MKIYFCKKFFLLCMGTQERERNLIKRFLRGIISGSTQEKIHRYKKSKWLLN